MCSGVTAIYFLMKLHETRQFPALHNSTEHERRYRCLLHPPDAAGIPMTGFWKNNEVSQTGTPDIQMPTAAEDLIDMTGVGTAKGPIMNRNLFVGAFLNGNHRAWLTGARVFRCTTEETKAEERGNWTHLMSAQARKSDSLNVSITNHIYYLSFKCKEGCDETNALKLLWVKKKTLYHFWFFTRVKVLSADQ